VGPGNDTPFFEDVRMLDGFRLTHRIWAAVAVFGLILGVVMVNAFVGMKAARDSLSHVHDHRMAAAVALGEMRQGYQVNRIEMLLMFQHAPDSPLLNVHGHPIDMHVDNIAKLRERNNAAEAVVLNRAVDAEEKALIEQMQAKRKAWQAKRDQVMAALKQGDFSPATMSAFLVAGRTEGAAFEESLAQLAQFQAQKADAETQAA
jgi:methyl-accepting chemotaxis protein-1 (serine sensor receptor)